MGKNEAILTFLGTGTSSGVPMIACNCRVCNSENPKDNRLRSSVMIEKGDTRIVIDTTPDFRYQMLREKVQRLDAVLFTHPHKDHIAGLDDIRAFNYFQGGAIDIFANELTMRALQNEFHYAFAAQKYPGVPELSLRPITDDVFSVKDIRINPINAWHLHMPVLGFRMGNLAYITDANRIEEKELAKLDGIDILILNALRREPHISHFTLDEAIAVADRLNVKQAYFTHISHQMGLHDDVIAELPSGRTLAWDGLRVAF